jgi:hypothetical protein
VGIGHGAGYTLVPDLDAHHEVQTEEDQVCKVLYGKGLAVKVSVDAPKAFETTCPEPESTQIGDENVPVVSHNDGSHIPFSCYEERYLSLNFEGKVGELPGQLMGDDLATGHSPAVESLEILELAGFQAAGFAVNFFYGSTLLTSKKIVNPRMFPLPYNP